MAFSGFIETTIKINDAFSKALDNLSNGLGKSQGAFNKLKGALSGDAFGSQEKQAKGFFSSIAGGAMVGNLMAAGLGQVKNMASEVVGSLDETSTAWNTFEGNMKFLGQSNKQIANTESQLQNYASKTIYSASDMASTYAQMKAVGVKNTTALVKGFGGLAAAADNPAQAMKSLSQQATQMAAKPKVQWEDFKIMLEQSPAGMSAVAKAMGMSTKQLVSSVQDGKIKTQQFFDAMTKAGNNKYFTGMATQFKTMGDAVDGLMDTLTYNLRKPWAAVSKFGINAINGLSDALGSIDYSKLASGITSALNSAQTFISNFVNTAKKDLGKMFDGFKDSGALEAVSNAFDTIKTSISKFSKASGKAAGGSDFFTKLGQFSGKAVVEIANAIASVATAISKIKPETLQNLAKAFVALKFGIKGIGLAVVVKALQKLADIPADTLNNLINAITGLAVALALFKGLMGVVKTISAIKEAFSGLTLPGTNEVGAGSAIAANAKAYMQLGAALLLVGAAVMLTATGFYILAAACINLASSGGGAIAIFFILLAVIIGLGVALAAFAPAIAASAAGFGAALALIGVSVLMVGAGLLLMSMSLSSIQTYGLGASLAMLALALGITALGIASIVGAVGLLLLGAAVLVVAVALAALGIGAIVAAAGVLMLAAAVAMLGVAMLIVSAAVTGIVTSMIAMIATVTAAVVAVAASIIAVVSSIAAAIIAVVSSIGSTIGSLIATAGATITEVIAGIADGITTVFQGVGDTITQIINSISTGISKVFNSIANVINSVGNSIHNAGMGMQEIAAGLRAIASVGIGKTVALLASLAGGLGKVAAQGSGLSSAGRGMVTLGAGATVAASAIARLKAVGSNIKIVAPKANFASTVSSVRAGMQAAASAANAGRGAIVAAVRSSIAAAVSAGRSAAASMHSVGVMIGAGLANGMRAEIGAVAAAADALVAQADRAARAKAKIHSPSRLFAEVGDFIGQGLAKGIDGTRSLIAHSSEGLIDSAYAAVNASAGEGFGDSLASGFMTAYGAIMQVVEALGGLDGAQATIGVKSAQTATMTALPTQSAVTTQVPTNLTQQAITNVAPAPVQVLNQAPAVAVSPAPVQAIGQAPAVTVLPSPVQALSQAPAVNVAPASPAVNVASAPAQPVISVAPAAVQAVSQLPAVNVIPAQAQAPAVNVAPTPVQAPNVIVLPSVAKSPAVNIATGSVQQQAVSQVPAVNVAPSSVQALNQAPVVNVAPSATQTPLVNVAPTPVQAPNISVLPAMAQAPTVLNQPAQPVVNQPAIINRPQPVIGQPAVINQPQPVVSQPAVINQIQPAVSQPAIVNNLQAPAVQADPVPVQITQSPISQAAPVQVVQPISQPVITQEQPTQAQPQAMPAINVGVMPIPSLASLLTPVQQIDYPKSPVYNVDSGSVTSSTISSTTVSNQTTNTTAPTSSYVINVQSGAIQVDGAKDPQKSAEQILAEIEEILSRQAAKAL